MTTNSVIHAFNNNPSMASSAGACGGQGWRGPDAQVTCESCIEIMKNPVACDMCAFRTDTADVLALHKGAEHSATPNRDAWRRLQAEATTANAHAAIQVAARKADALAPHAKVLDAGELWYAHALNAHAAAA